MKKWKVLHVLVLAAVAMAAALNSGAAEAGTLVYVSGGNGEFGTMDLFTGAFNQIGTINDGGNPVTLDAMGIGPDGKLYGLDASFPTSSLVQIDTANGNILSSYPNPLSGGESAIGGTTDASGKMWAMTFSTDFVHSTLYSLTPPLTTTTDAPTTTTNPQGMVAVNPAGTEVYISNVISGQQSLQLTRIDTATGVATDIGTGLGFYPGTTIPIAPLAGLFVNGTLYAFVASATDLQGTVYPAEIVTIDTTTGAATFVANYSLPGDDAVFAVSLIQAIPEPSSVVLGLIAVAAAGSVGLLRRRPATTAV